MDPSTSPERPNIFTFRDLKVWKLSRSLSADVYRACSLPGLRQHHALCDQMGRAALSVPSNIAEGNDRSSNKDALNFLRIARGSLAELETQLWIAHDVGWLDEESYKRLCEKHSEVERMLGGLIRTRQARLKNE
ncbi:MAG: four helix bundle protein [Verrucomicrobia bacterium]|nr:four helix bundle protein [Verrucomicrobiota bacterium]